MARSEDRGSSLREQRMMNGLEGEPESGGRTFKNPVKKAIREDRPVFGMYSDTLHPNLVELMAKAGVDFVILDTEHNAYGLQRCTECVRAADAAGITPLIRVYDNNPGLINKALEIGAKGIVVPHVDTPELAGQAVASAKYPPDGIRGVNPFTRASGYVSKSGDWEAVWRSANEEVLVVLQPLESEKGLANLPDIAGIPGVDLISLGLGDLSQALGAPLRADAPRVREAHERALRVCREKGVATYALVYDAAGLKKWMDRGVRVFVIGLDDGVFYQGCRTLMDSLREALS
jgi:4-hydroxy-2-oxoheptanedioate aldolase